MKYIDLSQKIEDGMPVYPGDIDVSLVQTKCLSKDQYCAFSLTTGLHAGTHIDCPMHLLDSNKSIAEYSLESFSGRGCLIDVRGIDVIDYKPEYTRKIQKGDIVLIFTGADKSYGSSDYYSNHPVMTNKLAEFLVSCEIKMLGVDMPSPDFPPFMVHKLLLQNGIFIIENLTNLEALVEIENFEVFAQPLRIYSEASLTRAFARIP